jgi:hypothetical protein
MRPGAVAHLALAQGHPCLQDHTKFHKYKQVERTSHTTYYY